LGNPVFGQRETSMVIIDHVFVPWERVFHCGEYQYSLKFVTRFAKTHRMTCGGTCKVGFMNQIIGAAKLIQEYKGLEKAPHINDQLMEMVVLRNRQSLRHGLCHERDRGPSRIRCLPPG
jgi:4-hydroxybutyryl-CoA dehydratase/vinylacetyl-CoA-Delta-isomerase